jgi:hypothetical protein
MTAAASHRTRWIVAAVLGAACLGLGGLVVVAEAALLRWRPGSVREETWRLAGLATCTTALVAGVVGGVVGLLRGLAVYPPTAFFAFLEGGALGAALGLLVGAGVGVVLAADLRRRAPQS